MLLDIEFLLQARVLIHAHAHAEAVAKGFGNLADWQKKHCHSARSGNTVSLIERDARLLWHMQVTSLFLSLRTNSFRRGRWEILA
ncbi:MAG: hypothetical protein LBQ20_11160 [Rhodanobacter sp.]|nr:hypothetical protein [Rhodanobacter sp.]